MSPLKITGLVGGPCVVGIGVILGLTDCGSSSTPHGQGNGNGASSSSGFGGSGAGNGGTGSGGTASSGTGSGGEGTSSGTGSSGTGSSGAGSSSGTGSSGTGSSGAGSNGGTTGDGCVSVSTASLVVPVSAVDADAGIAPDGGSGTNCTSGEKGPCTTFTTPTGTTLQLGPYGSSMDVNVGTGFENQVQSSDMPGSTTCSSFVALFNQAPALSAQLLNTSQNGIDLNFALYTVYRPANWGWGETFPIITWGNGTCAQPDGYGALLRYIASYGFVIVAANSREVGSGTPQPMLHALDFAIAANKDSTSPYYGKLDTTKIGAMGHSQGGSATVTAASDSRILYTIIFNGGDTCAKEYLAVSGDTDITGYTASGMASAVNGNTAAPGAWLFYHMVPNTGNLNGHLTLMLQPERVVGPATAWWEMVFRGDSTAKAWFEGTSCGLCNMTSEFEFGEHMLP
jgi:hypothetical protein